MGNNVAIIDYGLCNLDSISRAVEECGGTARVTRTPTDIETANRIILPGVGAFPAAMHRLEEVSWDQAIREQVENSEIPLLGICLGMQLLATKSFENGETRGLDLIPGEVRRLEPTEDDTRIPHMGWNEVHWVSDSALSSGLEQGRDFYFVHSYHLVCSDERHILGHTPYCGRFVSAVSNGLVFGTQFHPEKSQKTGFKVIENFLSI